MSVTLVMSLTSVRDRIQTEPEKKSWDPNVRHKFSPMENGTELSEAAAVAATTLADDESNRLPHDFQLNAPRAAEEEEEGGVAKPRPRSITTTMASSLMRNHNSTTTPPLLLASSSVGTNNNNINNDNIDFAATTWHANQAEEESTIVPVDNRETTATSSCASISSDNFNFQDSETTVRAGTSRRLVSVSTVYLLQRRDAVLTATEPDDILPHRHRNILEEAPQIGTAIEAPQLPPPKLPRYRLLVWIIVVQSVMLLASVIVNFLPTRSKGILGTGGGTNPTGEPSRRATLSTLEVIRANGNLSCGVVPRPGFSEFNGTHWNGFEVDLCRAVGAAIFEEDGRVNFVALNNSNRFTALKARQVDLLAAGVTYTMERDVYEATTQTGFTFSVPYLYNGLYFGGSEAHFVDCADQRNWTGNCSNLTICVQEDTTHAVVLREMLFPDSAIQLVPTLADFHGDFEVGKCNVLAGEQFDFPRSCSYISDKQLSKEPLALTTRDDDVEWSDFVNWVSLALLTAEVRNIPQNISQDVVNNPTVTIKTPIRFYHAVKTVGNYAEMYSRHLERLVPRAAINMQNNGTTPLIYSFPFGNTLTTGPGPIANGTLERIRQRGYLLCGTADVRFFATFNNVTQEWEGFDVDMCRAISSAIFNGKGSTVFVPVDGTSRWEKLRDGEIDVISWDTTWNYERDANFSRFPSANFTFTQPVFYTGMQFGGDARYVNCTEALQKNSCTRKICVNNGTTTEDALRALFRIEDITVTASNSEGDRCLQKPGFLLAYDGFILEVKVADSATTDNYKVGTEVFSRENLAIVTRQDDPQWSSFVNWVVMATFYADEHNITQSTADRMPTTQCFGKQLSNMLQNAIFGAGSHSEILSRSENGIYDARIINRVNVNDTPQHFPPGGLFGLH